MVLDLAKPVALLLCLLSLLSVFYAAFLLPASTVADRIYLSLFRLAFAAAFALLAGFIFRESELQADAQFDAEFSAHFGAGFASPARPSPLVTTLPMQIFCWAAAAMLILFIVSWYLETYYVPYQNLRY